MMKNKNLEFFAIKLLIFLLIEVVLMLFCFVISTVFRAVGLVSLLGERGGVVLAQGIAFLAFLVYSMFRAYRFRIADGEDRSGLFQFALREGAVYAAFLLPMLICTLILGAGGLPSWVSFFYAPQQLLLTATGSPAAGFGVPVLVYTAAVTAMRLAALSRRADAAPAVSEDETQS